MKYELDRQESTADDSDGVGTGQREDLSDVRRRLPPFFLTEWLNRNCTLMYCTYTYDTVFFNMIMQLIRSKLY